MHLSKQRDDRMLLFKSDERFHRHIMKECNVDEQYVRDGIKLILDWYNSQPHLPKYVLDFDFIEGMYANSKFSIEKTKKTLECYLSIRTTIPELFDPRDPLSQAMTTGNNYTECALIPDLTPDGSRIVHIKFTDMDPKLYDPEVGFKILFISRDLRLFLDEAGSETLLWDFANFTFGHTLKMTPTLLSKISYIFQNAYCIKMKAMHLINMNKYALIFAKLGKSLLTKKLGDRMHFHETVESLQNFLPKNCLVAELGGTAGEFDELCENQLKVVNSDRWRDWYITSGKELVDESKRPAINDDCKRFHHVSGTFRTLNFD